MKMWYVGVRWAGAIAVKVRSQEDLPIRHDLRHFADEFSWGNCSANSQQLAFALLVHRFGARTAARYAARFLKEVVSKLPADAWRLDAGRIDAWLQDTMHDEKQLEQALLPFENN